MENVDNETLDQMDIKSKNSCFITLNTIKRTF